MPTGILQVYVGKESNTSEHGLGERVVLQLTEQYRDKAYRIFCDNLFTSPVLFKELHEHGLYACGTVRQTCCGFPEDLRNPSLALGESLFRWNESLTAVVWKDKRPVHVLSTLSQPHEMVTVNRRQRYGSRAPHQLPVRNSDLHEAHGIG